MTGTYRVRRLDNYALDVLSPETRHASNSHSGLP
jgi:hypothetical protein